MSVFMPVPYWIFFSFIFISWRLITLQYCSGFCHTLTWISHGFTCVPHPEPPSHLPPHPIPLGHPSVPALSTCLMHPTWTGDLFHTDLITIALWQSLKKSESGGPPTLFLLFHVVLIISMSCNSIGILGLAFLFLQKGLLIEIILSL